MIRLWQKRIKSLLLMPFFLSFACYVQAFAQVSTQVPVHALALPGTPKYGPTFTHFDYVNPNAPKGGSVNMAATGTFDSFNPYIVKGTPSGVAAYETLMVSSKDESFSQYGLIAESVELSTNRDWIIFNLRPEARWHDGQPITAADVVFSFYLLKEKGKNLYRTYYADVIKAEMIDQKKVRFLFVNGDNPELPLIIGQLPILPKHYWESRDFTQPTLEVPLGSGPYKIVSFDPGRSVTIARVKDYWGQNLPVNRGQNNFDQITYRYYRDSTVMFEAFKAGEYDWRQENIARQWATGYEFPAVRDGRVVKRRVDHQRPMGLQALIYNIRRPFFQDPRVREALVYLFDFEWMNKTLFWNQYQRSLSYFNNSEMAARGLPSSEEMTILNPLRGQVPDRVFTQEFKLPVTDGSGNMRNQTRQALELLKQAGYEVQQGIMVQQKTGQPLSFEILLYDQSFERIVTPFAENLKKIGIRVTIRTIDIGQYQKRLDNFDFDMIQHIFAQTDSPGNEQRDFWGSSNAQVPGSLNLIGIQDPAIDQLIELVIRAPNRQSLIHHVRALDRVLLAHHFVIPEWYANFYNIAYWDIFGYPAVAPKYDIGFSTWWVDPKKAEQLNRRGR
ncbi:MAG TPA: extracellular solute-binding protein [Alphaproteobacteria bacterium]|jgi:microcin C transport system substrate-binding protein|nr:extracellular solute-binding protein [Alphaproteobacteria bacterium]